MNKRLKYACPISMREDEKAMNEKTKKILVNTVYNGKYGVDKNNLPHELINFFRTDNKEFYVYITPYGLLNREFFEGLETILFVNSVGNNRVEVVAMAEVGGIGQGDNFDEFYAISSDSTKKHPMEKKKKKGYIYYKDEHAGKITYGEKPLAEIHEKNAKDNGVYVTLKVKSIRLPQKAIYITTKAGVQDALFIDGFGDTGKVVGQSMIKCYDERKDADIYSSLLKKIVEGKEWLEPEDTPTFAEAKDKIFEENNFFKITRQQNNEVMFSNMFFYLFSKYPELLKRFAKKVLEESIRKDPNKDDVVVIDLSDIVLVEREKNRMDLRIIDDAYYIIIENKIKSAINGMEKDEEKEDFKKENGKYISQLSKYYQEAEDQNKNDGKPRTILGFVFMPNYNPIKLENYYLGEKYVAVSYRDIYEFFLEPENAKLESENAKQDMLYLRDFISAMKKHTTDTDNEFRDELLLRLAERINA